MYLRTSLIVLIIGIISFGVGIFTLSICSISRIPWRIFSGFYGFVILFLSVYIHITDLDIMELFLKRVLYFHVNWKSLYYFWYPCSWVFPILCWPITFAIWKKTMKPPLYAALVYRQKRLWFVFTLYVIAFLDILY